MVVRTRGGLDELNYDAYFTDEAGLTYPNAPKQGARLNKYTRIFVKPPTGGKEISQADAAARHIDPADQSQIDHLQSGTVVPRLTNPLDASVNPLVKHPEAEIPVSARGHKGFYTAFVPAQLLTDMRDLLARNKQCPRPVQVTLFFGTGSEMGRHGLRTFIDRAFWRMIINVPGVEPGYRYAEGHRWGIGISDAQIRDIVKSCFGSDKVPFVVDRMAAFSTGYIGATGTIRNQLIDLRDVAVYSFFDCNYGEARVNEAIRLLKQETRNRVRVIAYASSVAGTPTAVKHTIPLDISTGGAVWLFGRTDFQILTHARVLASGLADKTVDPSEIDGSIRSQITAFLAGLPARGTVVTDPGIHQLINGRGPASGTVTLDGWYKAHKADADLFFKALWHKTGSSPELIRTIWKHQLPGWPGLPNGGDADRVPVQSFGEGVHDFVPFEFGWEVLA